MPQLTIFTPTYNRANLLPRLYNSLKHQTNKDFTWMVIDDGSTDNTSEVISHFTDVHITYVRNNHGGKHRAHNTGVKLCKTELFVCVDSDDYLSDLAVEKILNRWSKVKKYRQIAGIVSPRQQNGYRPVLPCNNGDVTTLHELYNKGFVGETTLAFRTEVLQEFPFPEFEGENFITEAVVYDRIDCKYQLSCLSDWLTIGQYQEDGLTAKSMALMIQNPNGWALFFNQRSATLPTLKKRVKAAGQYLTFAKMAHQRHILPNAIKPHYVLASIPWALLYYRHHLIKSTAL